VRARIAAGPTVAPGLALAEESNRRAGVLEDALEASGRAAAPRAIDPRVRVFYALGWGLATHLLFAFAILSMLAALYGGLQIGIGRFHGTAAVVANALLALQFPLLHSWLLTVRGGRLLARLAPRALGRDLAPTTFAAVASLQLIATFWLWSPSDRVVDAPSGAMLFAWRVVFAASWVLLVKALYDAGLALQTGFVGWSAVLRGRRPEHKPFPTHGLFRCCRQPVYLGFAATLWTGPVHTLDGLSLALLWTTYCVLGPLHKERRYLSWYREQYAAYQDRVPYFLPRIRR
jgi:protein-S-isoprenylcysteine O-methyltransferase Ste14